MTPYPMALRAPRGRYWFPVALSVLGLMGLLSPEASGVVRNQIRPPLEAAGLPYAGAGISNISVTPAYNRVTVSWTTAVPTDTVIQFVGQQATGQTWSRSQGLTTRHILVINGLGSEQVYRWFIVATDAAGRQSVSLPLGFRTLFGTLPQPRPGSVCQCGFYFPTRPMTPAERERLRASFDRYANPKLELSQAEKSILFTIKTNPASEDDFNNRLQQARAWLDSLRRAGKDVEKLAQAPRLLQTQYYVNRVAAARKLDRFVAELARLDNITR